uniref:NADH-ubiquinone oxidoreductase chain 3 n=1 Tax=Aulacus sinensis TaxID=2491146 RepID=A0A3Q8U9U9_9HYME|nr:NADH dehydrogenase subunit 3 [Aulacus sinensis]
MMFNLLIMFFIIMLINFLLFLINLNMSKKKKISREKSSPFECGFNPMNSIRLPFSIHFYLISLIFLIFDVEISLILPMIINYKFTFLLNWKLINLFFFMILLMGLFIEWIDGSINWIK